MIKITPPSRFKTINWKNGKGQTTELAISKGGTINDFDWRLSIASVVEDGLFSDFSGYQRNLILLNGQGIKLIHDDKSVDLLESPLSIAKFDGASKTSGHLINGPISDFNVMTKKESLQAHVSTFNETQNFKLSYSGLAFIYSQISAITIEDETEVLNVPKCHLVTITDRHSISISGKQLIVINLSHL